ASAPAKVARADGTPVPRKTGAPVTPRRAATVTPPADNRVRAAILAAIARAAAAVRGLPAKLRRPAKHEAVDPTLPAAAQIVQVQHPSATLPARPYDLVLIVAVLGLLGIGTVEIYSATAAEGLTKQHGDSLFFLVRQLMFAGIGGVALWFGARLD